MQRLQHLLDGWTGVGKVVREADRLFLFTDYDGTLVPIVDNPGRSRLHPQTRLLLRRLAHLEGVRLGIVSGRAIQTIRRQVQIPQLSYAGNHGLEIRGPRVRFQHPQAVAHRPIMRTVARDLATALRDIPGVLIESKRLSLSVHWRKVAATARVRFKVRARQALAPWVRTRAIRVTVGKRVLDICPPVGWDKGEAVRWCLKAWRYRGGPVLYFGDDRTDEDAFRVVNRIGGLSVFVGDHPRTTAARWWLRDSHEVHRALEWILGERWRKQAR